MANDKEFREFFVRNTKVSTGLKADKEPGFPISQVVNGKTVFNRFLKNNIPSENVFKKLFNSILFCLNPEDSMTTSKSGHAKLATNTQVTNGTNVDPSGFTLVPKVTDIPKFVGFNEYTESINSNSRRVINSNIQILYDLTINPSNYIFGVPLGIFNTLTTIERLSFYKLLANSLRTKGSEIEINFCFSASGTGTLVTSISNINDTNNTAINKIVKTYSLVNNDVFYAKTRIILKQDNYLRVVTETRKINSGTVTDNTTEDGISNQFGDLTVNDIYLNVFATFGTANNILLTEHTIKLIQK